MPKCIHPSCDRKIDAKSLTKCCRDHQHSEFCQCATCVAYRERVKRRASRPHVTTVHVPRSGCYHGDVIYDPVSVSRAPWEKATC
jgi:hypothetical protein